MNTGFRVESPIARIDLDHSYQCAALYVQGYLDETTAPAFREKLYQTIDAGFRDLIVEMSGAVGVGSVGIGALICAFRRFDGERGRIVLASCSPALASLLQMAGIRDLFPFFPNVDQARQELLREAHQVLEPVSEKSAALRRWLREVIQPMEISVPERDALEAAASEAFNNAVEHASPQKSSLVSVRAFMSSTVTIELEDKGPGFEARQYFAADPDSLHIDTLGLGIHVMRNLMDKVEFIAGESGTTDSPAGTTVRLVKRLAAAPARKGGR